MDHPCNKEAEISEMMTLMKGLVKEFYGNGSPGIAKTVPVLQKSIETLTENVAAQTKVISDLVEFQTSTNAVSQYKEKEALSTRQRAAIIVTAVISCAGIAVTLIMKLI